MNKQPEALRLAECLDDVTFTTRGQATDAAAELRRLYAENQALADALQYQMGCYLEMGELALRQRARLDELERLQPKRKPMLQKS